jgi:phosphoribosylglycinamide formyltransferase-1
MVHLATEDVDRGPVLSYCTVPISGGNFAELWKELDRHDLVQLKKELGEDMPLFQRIRQTQYLREPYLLFETLRCVAEGQVVVGQEQVLDRAGQPLAVTQPLGLCLDQQIGEAMQADGLQPMQ